MSSENFPIFRSALELCVYVETIVKGFDKYHKYTIGKELRKFSKDLLFLVNSVGLAKDKVRVLARLRDRCEDMKMLLLIAKELKVCKSFKQLQLKPKSRSDT